MNEQQASRLKNVKLFLFDLDGTVYLGNEPIPGAVEFIGDLKRRGVGYLFLTNNSSKRAGEYVDKLNKMGFAAGPDQVVTSGQATGWYLAKKKPGAAIYLVGTDSLKAELKQFGLTIVDAPESTVEYVVVGFDTELAYDKLRVACDMLSGGAGFIATNPDLVCPIGAGRYIPDCGSICAMLENAVKRTPVYVGKPHTIMIDYIRSRQPLILEQLVMVGDRLYTDIALGCNASIMSICVLSGETDKRAIALSDYQPDIVVESVAEIGRLLK